MYLFHALVSLLRLDGQGGNRPGFQAFQTDRLACFFTETVAAVFDPEQGLADLGDQLPGTVSRP